jgi:3',5'-cyclic-AMP phosphodiesterase
MLIYLPPINRRRFLAGTLAAGAGLLLPRSLAAEEPPVDPNFFLLLSDPHIVKQRNMVFKEAKPVEAFEQVCADVLSLPSRPVGAILAGDCASLSGDPAEYRMLAELLKPLRQAGIPLRLLVGNHDDRENFLKAFPDAAILAAEGTEGLHRFISLWETPHANWFLMDSLSETNSTPGALGEDQLAWLAKALDARPDKPAMIVAHHDPNSAIRKRGLTDVEPLMEILTPRRQVKAFFFGHTHCWGVAQSGDLQLLLKNIPLVRFGQGIGQTGDVHLVNLPSTALPFNPTEPRGSVALQLRHDGASLVLHALDHRHPRNGQKIDLVWRA